MQNAPRGDWPQARRPAILPVRMKPFWALARRMLRYRRLLLAAVLMAFISAGGLGVGLVGVVPILGTILPGTDPVTKLPRPSKDLPQIVSGWDAQLRNSGIGSGLGLHIPREWIDALPTGPFTAIVLMISVLGTLTVFGGIANFLHAYLSLTVVQRTITNLRREAFHKVLRLPLKQVVASGPMDVISRIVNDTTTLAGGFTAMLSKALAQLTKGVASLAVAFLVDWRMALTAVPAALVLGLLIRKLGTRIRRASRSALQSQALLYGAASEALQGLRVVKVHATERFEAGRFHRINKEVMRQLNRVRTARALASPLIDVLAIFVVGVLGLVAAKMILDGKLDPGHFLVVLAALAAAGASFKPLSGIWSDVQGSAGAAGRLVELLSLQPEPGHDSTLPRLPRHKHSIEFRTVTFTYPNASTPSLRDIDLTVSHGETVAVVGPNGSGKTTLLALVPRLFDPQAGQILIDGRDIRDFNIRSLRRQIGVVTQETVLFRGTVRSNIAYGAENATEERIRQAARKARADGFVSAMSDGFDTTVAEQGLSLSGGQRQRLAIARAILRDPAILILDEATSMIDADSENKIAEAIAEFSAGRTCLIVAHRLSTVLNADRIVVMDQGRIVDTGTHTELLDRCEVYRALAQHQLVPMTAAAAGK